MSEMKKMELAAAENLPAAGDIETVISDIEAKNPRIAKVMRLQEEIYRQNEKESLRGKRIRQEQEHIDNIRDSVEKNLRNTREEQRYNTEFEERIRVQVYELHGISEDKIQGMEEYQNARHQGTSFTLFFLSLFLFTFCGVLHSFDSKISIFMAFFTAVQGALLLNGTKQPLILTIVMRICQMLLFPAMMVMFICYELQFREYDLLLPVFTIVGIVILTAGTASFFVYDPYRLDRRNRKRANNYMRDMEKAALKEVKLKERVLEREARKNERQVSREERKQMRIKQRQEKKEKKRVLLEERKANKIENRREKKDWENQFDRERGEE